MSDPKVSIHNRHVRSAQTAYRPVKRPLPPTRLGVYSGAGSSKPGESSSEPPPAKYICFKCAEKGHWIFDCPLGVNAKKKFRMATGIPRPMLRVIPREEKDAHDSVLILPDGQLAVLQELTEASFEQQVGTFKTREWKCQQSFGFGFLDALKELVCPACNDLFKDPIQLPCCLSTACTNCVGTQGSLLHLQCPVCKERVSTYQFIPNTIISTLCKEIIQRHVTLPTAIERKCMEAYYKKKLKPKEKLNTANENVINYGKINTLSDRDRERELMWERDQQLVGERAKEYAMALASSSVPPPPPALSEQEFEYAKKCQAIIKKEVLRRLKICLQNVEQYGLVALPPETQNLNSLLELLANLAPTDETDELCCARSDPNEYNNIM